MHVQPRSTILEKPGSGQHEMSDSAQSTPRAEEIGILRNVPLLPPPHRHNPLLRLHTYTQRGIQPINPLLPHERQRRQPQKRVQNICPPSAHTHPLPAHSKPTWRRPWLWQLRKPSYPMLRLLQEEIPIRVHIQQIYLLQHLHHPACQHWGRRGC